MMCVCDGTIEIVRLLSATFNTKYVCRTYFLVGLSPCLLFHGIRCWLIPIGTFPMKHSHFGESLCCRNKFFTTFFFLISFSRFVRFFFASSTFFLVFGLFFSCYIYLTRLCICWKPLYFFYPNGASTRKKAICT